MSKTRPDYPAVITSDALEDIREILAWSLDKFGEGAARRYRALLIQALRDLEADPMRPGSRTRPDLAPNARIYHLASSRTNVEGAPVQAPRHFILYRIEASGLQIARILHDSRDLSRHVPASFKS